MVDIEDEKRTHRYKDGQSASYETRDLLAQSAAWCYNKINLIFRNEKESADVYRSVGRTCGKDETC